MENWRCDDLGTISPFKEMAEAQEEEGIFNWEEEDFNLFFSDREDAILKYVMVGEYDETPVDIIYLCADTFSFPALMEQARAFGLDISDSQISLAETLNSFSTTLKKFNLSFKIHGGILLSLGTDGDYYELIDQYDTLDAAIPGYPYHELAIVDHSTVYCEAAAAP